MREDKIEIKINNRINKIEGRYDCTKPKDISSLLPGYDGVGTRKARVEDVFNYGGRILYLSTQPLKRSFSAPKSAAKRMLLVWEQTLSGSQVAMG